MLDEIDVPIVKDVGEKVDVAAGGKRIGEHVSDMDVDAIGIATIGEAALSDAIDGRFFEDGGAEMRMAGDNGAGVDGGAAGDIEEVTVFRAVELLSHGGREVNTA